MKSKLRKQIILSVGIGCGLYLLLLILLNVVATAHQNTYYEYIPLEVLLETDTDSALIITKSIHPISWQWNLWYAIQQIRQVLRAVDLFPDIQAQVKRIATRTHTAYYECKDNPAPCECLARQLHPINQMEGTPSDSSTMENQDLFNRDSSIVHIINAHIRVANSIYPEDLIPWNVCEEDVIEYMTLSEKVGQCYILEIHGAELLPEERMLLRVFQPGGILLRKRSCQSPIQLRQLIRSIQQTNPLYPLFIAVDQEGGPVKPIEWDPVPGAKEMKMQTKDVLVEQYYAIRDSLLADLGISMNFGLVADRTANPYAYIYPRCYGSDPKKVKHFIELALNATNQTLLVVKHFPGHGATYRNTHDGAVMLNLPWDKWEREHGIIFYHSIQQHAPGIMLGHLIYPTLTGADPASISESAVTWLRKTWNYHGLILTDDLAMLTQQTNSDPKMVLEKAWIAGVDILLYTGNEVSPSLLQSIPISLIHNRKMGLDRLNKSVARILEAKQHITYNMKPD